MSKVSDKEQKRRDELVGKLTEWLKNSEQSTSEITHQESAEEDYAFYAGQQDSTEDLQKLSDANRPATVYNEIMPKINMLVGTAAQNPYMPETLPVGPEDEPLSELMNGALLHYRNQMKMPMGEQDCFDHTLKAGRSLLHFYIDKGNPFEPEIKAKRIRTDNFHLDPDSTMYDMSDARYYFIDQWVTEDELKVYLPDLEVSGVKSFSRETDTPEFFNEAMDKYRLVEAWYRELIKVVWFMNPMTGKPEYLEPAEYRKFAKMVKEGIPVDENGRIFKTDDPIEHYDSFVKEIRYCLFISNYYIEGGKNPYTFGGGKMYPSVLYGAYKNEGKNAWFSVITMMKDPQKGLNTMRRQLSHLLQTLPKGILVHEAGVILNIDEYDEHGSEPTFHLELQKGGMERYKFEKQPAISTVYQTFDGTCSQGMKDASGIQNEMMGLQTTSREPGVSIRLRHQTGIAVIYSLFKNFSNSRVQGGKILMGMIQQFITTPQMIRIEGEKGAELLQINSEMNPQSEGFNDITAGKFDLYVDEIMEIPTMKSAIAQILTEFSHNNPNTIPPDIILEYSDIPYSTKLRIKKNWEAQQALAKEKEDRDYELELFKLEIEAAKANIIRAKSKETK